MSVLEGKRITWSTGVHGSVANPPTKRVGNVQAVAYADSWMLLVLDDDGALHSVWFGGDVRVLSNAEAHPYRKPTVMPGDLS